MLDSFVNESWKWCTCEEAWFVTGRDIFAKMGEAVKNAKILEVTLKLLTCDGAVNNSFSKEPECNIPIMLLRHLYYIRRIQNISKIFITFFVVFNQFLNSFKFNHKIYF